MFVMSMCGHASNILDDMLCDFYLQWDGEDTQDRLNIKTFFRYGNSDYKDMTALQQSFLYDGDTYTGNTTSLC